MNRRNRRKRMAAQAAQETLRRPAARENREAPQEALLDLLEQGGAHLQRLEKLLATSRDPGLEALVSLHRRFVLGLCARTDDPKVMLQLAGSTMKLLLAWARIEEKRRDRDLAERKFNAEQASRARDSQGASGGLAPETLEKIQGELRLI
jgi:hypothetical protein